MTFVGTKQQHNATLTHPPSTLNKRKKKEEKNDRVAQLLTYKNRYRWLDDLYPSTVTTWLCVAELYNSNTP